MHSALTTIERSLADEWRDRLMIEALKDEVLAERETNLSLFKDILRRLSSLETDTLDGIGEPSPDVDVLRALRQTVEGWLAKESMPAGPGLFLVASSILQHAPRTVQDVGAPQAELGTQVWLEPRLVALFALLSNYRETQRAEFADSIAAQLDALAESREAAPLVAVVREYYGHPNVWIDISEDLLDDSIAAEVDRCDKIDTVVLETPVSGKGRVRALRALVIEPGANAALLKIVVEGTIDSTTVGRRSSVRIKSHTLTSFRAEKPVILDASGLTVLPAVCEAKTQTLSSDVTTSKPGLRGQIVQRVARRRAESLRDAADLESSLQAEARVLDTIDREADILVKKLNRVAVLPVTLLASGSGSGLYVRSEERVLRIGSVVGPLGAPANHPPCDDHQLVTVRVHQSLARRLSRQAVDELIAATRSELPSLLTLVGSAKTTMATGQAGDSPSVLSGLSRLSVPRPLDSWRPTRLGWNVAQSMAAPRLTGRGVMLRDGKWGTILPVKATGEWLAAEWRPALAGQRMAKAPANSTK
ncbi:MAG: hypothetical protein ACREHD_24760 [Pirellulales bacterium]